MTELNISDIATASETFIKPVQLVLKHVILFEGVADLRMSFENNDKSSCFGALYICSLTKILTTSTLQKHSMSYFDCQ